MCLVKYKLPARFWDCSVGINTPLPIKLSQETIPQISYQSTANEVGAIHRTVGTRTKIWYLSHKDMIRRISKNLHKSYWHTPGHSTAGPETDGKDSRFVTVERQLFSGKAEVFNLKKFNGKASVFKNLKIFAFSTY